MMSHNLHCGMNVFVKQAAPRGAESLGANLPCGRGSWGKFPGCSQKEECAERGSHTAPLAWKMALKAEPGPAEKNTAWR